MTIGSTVLHPMGMRIRITSGQYRGEYNRISNWWQGFIVNTDGSDGEPWSGYGFEPQKRPAKFILAFDVIKSKWVLSERKDGKQIRILGPFKSSAEAIQVGLAECGPDDYVWDKEG